VQKEVGEKVKEAVEVNTWAVNHETRRAAQQLRYVNEMETLELMEPVIECDVGPPQGHASAPAWWLLSPANLSLHTWAAQ
jgi:hypothetical protein